MPIPAMIFKGPGTLFLYGEIGQPAIECKDVTIIEWPSAGNEHALTFKPSEKSIGWQLAKTKLRYFYTEKLVS